MKKFLAVSIIGIFVFASSAMLAFKLGGEDMVRAGVGKRTMFILGTVYYASLYVPKDLKGKSASTIINADKPMSVVLYITSGLINKSRFISATRKGFKKAASSGYRTAHSGRFLSMLKNIDKKDKLYFYYTPGVGTVVKQKLKKNGQVKTLGVIRGLGFKKALWAIWLGPKPVQSSLKRGMLGR